MINSADDFGGEDFDLLSLNHIDKLLEIHVSDNGIISISLDTVEDFKKNTK